MTIKPTITKKTFIILGLALIGFTACKKDEKDLVADAVVKYTGALAADGCGYLIETDNTTYKAENLPAEYEQDKLVVHIRYKVLNTKYYCGMLPNNAGITYIHINSIEKN
jgi:hypothetical protein